MNIKFSDTPTLDKNSIYVIIEKRKYLLTLRLQTNYNLKKDYNQELLKNFIKISLNELELLEKTPKEIVKKQNHNFFNLHSFIMISYTLFYNKFHLYIVHMIKQHIKTKNYDFLDFNLRNLDKRWFYIEENTKDRLTVKEELEKLFLNIVSKEKNDTPYYITKNEHYTPEIHIWDIKCENLYFKDIRFNIPNKEVREIIYNKEKFVKFFDSIKYCMLNKKPFLNITKSGNIFILFIVLVSLLFLKEFREVIKHFVNKLINSFEIVTVFNLKIILFNQTNNKTLNYILSIHREGNAKKNHYNNNLYNHFASVILDEVEKGYQRQYLAKRTTNEKLLKQNTLLWKYQKTSSNNKINFSIVNFSKFGNIDFLKEIKSYYKWIILADRNISSVFSYLIIFIEFILDEKQIKNFSSFDITNNDMKKFAMLLIAGENKNIKKLKISTRSSIFNCLKNIFTFIIENEISLKHNLPKLLKNPCHGIVFNRIDDHTEAYQPLPEEIYSQILIHSNELETPIKNAFIVLSATGLRWKELINLKTDCLFKKQNTWYIKAKEYKTLKFKRKMGKTEYRNIPIHDNNVLLSIKEQIKYLNDNNIDSEKIFMRRNKTFTSTSYSLISGSSYNESINNLIFRNNIITDNGILWNYTSHQMRVRIATLMAENGFIAEEISAFLNHASTQTINKAYAFVNKKRLSELNTDFFKKHFQYIIPKDKMKKLTIKERKSLYVKLFLNYRQMEYGKCIIPMSENDCGKLQMSKNCASCQYLVTSKDYIVHWKKFFNNQKTRIEKLEKFYLDNNIQREEYQEYMEYEREIFFLKSYEEVLIKIGEYND
ncbi:hypothetical protein ALC152_19960 [Arcobacter sp. 15-2]|uniref:tyrosine-type recombinase/integrase n=1 Tax=Arcobacter sp. 15-2 TaxID=3374109 RepID=UPI00399CC25D